MLSFQFHDPWWLLLLIPLAVLGYYLLRRHRSAAVVYSDVSIAAAMPKTLAVTVREYLPWIFFIGVGLMILGLARPQQGKEEFRVKTEGIAIEMCLDRSGSMRAMDFEINGKRVDRLDAVKKVFENFVEGDESDLSGRTDDEIGLVVFGGFADAKCPLTLDHNALVDILRSIEIPKPVLDKQGRVINERLLQEELSTAVGDALVLAVDRLVDSKEKSKVIILLSDGKSNTGVVDPVEAVEAAKAHGIKIYTIGVGTTGMAPFPMMDRQGRTVLEMQPVEIDTATLKHLADETGGKYFHANDTEALKQVYAQIDELEKTVTEKRVYTQYRELFRYFLLPGLALILVQVTLASTRFRSIP